ncbi:MAG: HPP family protein [Hyphomicrobiales bacterium]|nr:HPP family protein [Hyphomicrobiales bacterium]
MNKLTLIKGVISGLGACVGVMLMFKLGEISSVPLSAIPFATSIVLVAGTPTAAPARNRAIILGHLICGGMGVLMHFSGLESPWAVAIAVAASVVIMLAVDAFHPPAGITPFVLYASTFDWDFLIVPVLTGAVTVAILARTIEKLMQLADKLWTVPPRSP